MAGGLKAAVAECKAAKKAEAGAGGAGRDRWVAGIEAHAMAVNMGSLLSTQILIMCLWGHCSSYNFEDPA